jgi:hypothetical protein
MGMGMYVESSIDTTAGMRFLEYRTVPQYTNTQKEESGIQER